MTEAAKQYCIVLVANPYPQACVTEALPSGGPMIKRTRTHGRWYDCVEAISPYCIGGAYWATGWSVLDPTPRTWADAFDRAARMPRQGHLSPRVTREEAIAYISGAATLA